MKRGNKNGEERQTKTKLDKTEITHIQRQRRKDIKMNKKCKEKRKVKQKRNK